MSLASLREKANLSQEAVAKALEVDQSTVSKWESGNRNPLMKYWKKLARLYGCSVKELFQPEDSVEEG